MPKEEAKEFEEINVRGMNIFEKLSAISLEITNVAKNLNVSTGKSGSYKAVGEGDVLAAVRPAEAKYRVYSYPCNRRIVETGVLETTNSYGDIKKQMWERIEITYRFVNMDKPEEFVDIISYGDGIDTGDKSVGKAMTYGDKYALLKAYKIITGEDPDQDPSEPLVRRETRRPAENKPVSDEVLEEMKALNITLEQVADYKKIKVEDLTDEIIRPVLMATKRKRAKQAAQAKLDTTKEAQPQDTTNKE